MSGAVKRNNSCLFPITEFDHHPFHPSQTSFSLANYSNLSYSYFTNNNNINYPNYRFFNDHNRHHSSSAMILNAGFLHHSSRYAQNGAPQYRPNSVHDYQPLAPFQENPHLPPISTMGTAPGQNSKSVYDAHDDENYCINWKCIITLCCILALLIIGLVFLLS